MTRTTPAPPETARDWVRILAAYRDPDTRRSAWELSITLAAFAALWVAAWFALQVHWSLALAVGIVNGGFLVRLFAIQHDCGHGSFFVNRHLSDWTGRLLGIVTLTPYDVWRRTHAIHHSHAGNLDHRGIGDVTTLTVEEYRALSPLRRLAYRLYRHPLVMFGLGPSYLFLLQNRLPLGLMTQGARYWLSAMLTNLAIGLIVAATWWGGGWLAVAVVFFPPILIAASAGVWLFYVQHQFETTMWEQDPDWQLHEAALHGSSHYDLPQPLAWMTANIGIHHVHHLYSRIPFYRLPDVLRDHKELVEVSRMTLRQSLRCASLDLWDAQSNRLISFRQAHATA
ncbi:omega-6 fatty acid desaturase (delta-12 desaturase) [Loktanella fryxellensis]|uniref:Omega-6 fatty acid desaturase (Delta-12 desaturase) n=1 Tax=Loktanella fryxellensis TaxID=245187 RepID=A0A1H8I171_9RHOB|nr:fatty acid desaturase [Loktanella fryxellensis]SEN62001.1 omega-6 fatty acid desaturase (delta-12 desaturase) [Loktanella fryxellensis]